MHTYLTRVHDYHSDKMRQPQSLPMSWGPIQYPPPPFQSNCKTVATDITLSRPYDHEILRQDVLHDIESTPASLVAR